MIGAAGSAWLQACYRASRSRLCPPDQVINAPDANYDLRGDTAAAAVVSANWDVWLPGKTVPLLWERVEPDDWPCEPV